MFPGFSLIVYNLGVVFAVMASFDRRRLFATFITYLFGVSREPAPIEIKDTEGVGVCKKLEKPRVSSDSITLQSKKQAT